MLKSISKGGNKMTLQQLIYLVTAAECGNMTEAAAKLYISQPSLSAAIRNLEEEMGVTAFSRTNKGITVTREGEELLSYARMLLEQSENMKDHFCNSKHQIPKFSVSCQHYSFAVNAFVDVIKTFDADRYNFIMRETQTGEIIDDVANGKSEIGIIFLSEHNEEILSKLIRNNNLIFEELYVAKPHIFIYKHHPLAKKDKITLDDLTQYPYLVYEQGTRNSFYFSEEFISTLDFPKIIQVRDRATLFNLVIGLNGFTVSSGIIDHRLNGPHIIAKPLIADQTMHIGIVKKKNMILSRYAHKYIEALKEHLSIV
ncbi:LysR family transcriptional regulator [Kandleria vitulina DSM 20405]|jgi:DNA-binding transcriptional LysR family regulator|uniref:LysR family transcriptional regulator n=2 Tax=Kandleria vitulina TaxID=1630 RepID=A0A0R2HK29_9FIRM|nr:LysR family transcriptional regulator [Kandleria vitulina DSM 20405]